MQLLILLAMLLTGGSDADNLLKQVQPLLKNMGGEDMQNTLKQAEELYGMVTALQNMGGNGAPSSGGNTADSGVNGSKNGGFALAPIANIADDEVICRMTKYIADNP